MPSPIHLCRSCTEVVVSAEGQCCADCLANDPDEIEDDGFDDSDDMRREVMPRTMTEGF